jgi:hypothetical protein
MVTKEITPLKSFQKISIDGYEFCFAGNSIKSFLIESKAIFKAKRKIFPGF